MRRHLGSPARAWVCPYCLPDPSLQSTDTLGNQEAGALAQVCDIVTDPSVDTTDWVHRESHYHSIQVECRIAKDADCSLKCSGLVNAVTACPVCSTQCPRQLSKGSGAIHNIDSSLWARVLKCLGLCGHCVWPNPSFPVTAQTRLPPLRD